MRVFLVALVLLALPLTASAQHERRADPPRSALGSIGLPLPVLGAHAPAVERKQQPPAWERQQPPAWERKQVPPWERPQTPWWENKQPPPWERGHVAQPRPVVDYRRRPQQSPQVVYVMQPYAVPVQQPPQIIYVMQPAPEPAPEKVAPPPEPPQPPPPPPPPVVVPIGNRTMYIIAGCYLGNVPPQAEDLPPHCDISKLVIRRP